ncbi:MAG: hypothetical protein VCD31_05630, partial [Alphaproteobacteria bacterium]
MAFDNLQFMSVRDRAGVYHHDKLFGLSGAPTASNSGREFGLVIAEAAGLDDDGALAARESDAFFGEDGFGFDDFLDLINPLQHIPIVSTIYRELTSDEISPGARILGGAIFGGPVGFAAALGNTAVEQVAGKDVGELALSLFDSDAPESEVMTAEFAPMPVASDPEAVVLNKISPAAGDAPPSAAEVTPDEEPAKPAQRLNSLELIELMDDEQKALLLSSLGIASEPVEKSGKDEAVSGPTGGGEETDALFSHASASPDPLPPIGSKMEWRESAVPPGVDPSSPDWIAKAMSRAL